MQVMFVKGTYEHNLSQLEYAGGGGLRITTPLGPIRFDVAIPLSDIQSKRDSVLFEYRRGFLMRKRKNSFLLYSSLGLGIFILIIILGYFLTQSSYFLNFARKTLISQVNKQINGSIDIATIEGNIFTNLSLYNIVLSAKTSDSLKPEVISLKQLDLNYYLGSLLHKKIIISSILVSDLAINLHKDNQGTWNLAKIPIQKDSTKTDTTSSSWQIELEGLIVSNSKVNISGDNLPEQYPREISISQLISQASLGEELEWKLSKAELAVQPQEITISLNDLRGNDQLDFSLKLLEISSPKSQIQVTGNLINLTLNVMQI